MILKVLRTFFILASLIMAGGIALEAFSACWLEKEKLIGIARRNAGTKDPLETADHFVSFLRPVLANRPTIGYVNSRISRSQAGEVVTFNDPRDRLTFIRLQYAIAPTVLTPDPTFPWLLARFDTQNELLQFRTAGNYDIMANPAPGFGLLKRRDGK